MFKARKEPVEDWDLYVREDMKLTGYIFEYCDYLAQDFYNFSGNFNIDLFIDDLVHSQFRRELDDCHPRLLSQCTDESFQAYVNVDLKGDLSKYNDPNYEFTYNIGELMWCGEFYAYITHRDGIPMAKLFEMIPWVDMRHIYICGHQILSYEDVYAHYFLD